jgi:hypothetical protein
LVKLGVTMIPHQLWLSYFFWILPISQTTSSPKSRPFISSFPWSLGHHQWAAGLLADFDPAVFLSSPNFLKPDMLSTRSLLIHTHWLHHFCFCFFSPTDSTFPVPRKREWPFFLPLLRYCFLKTTFWS